MSIETKLIKAVESLEEAKKLLVEAISTDPENEFLEMIDTRIKEAIIFITSSRYERPNNKDCLGCNNSFTMKGNRLICMAKQKDGKTVKQSIVSEDGYCEEWN
jgi:GTP cyclohydrolase I